MDQALYGESGFYTRASSGGARATFRTSAHASPLFATAILRLIAVVDDALGRPDPLDVVDIGAGDGSLLRRLAILAPTYLAPRLRLTAVELAPQPPDLPDHIGWRADLPVPHEVTGVVLTTEWLDNIPLDIAEVDSDGALRYVLVDPHTGAETLGGPLSAEDAAWASRWWSEVPWEPGVRLELGAPRDHAWQRAVAGLSRGLALAVDYGHMRYARPRYGTLTGFLAGRSISPVPDGSRDLTAHVAIDAVCVAGEQVAGQTALLVRQREALSALGVEGSRPPIELATRDPAAYVRALSLASEAAELRDPDGLGGHYWLVQPVGIPGDCLPSGLVAASDADLRPGQ